MMRFAIFVVVFTLVMGLMTYVVGSRVLPILPATPMASRALWAVAALFGVCTLVALATRPNGSVAVQVVTWIGYTWLGVLFLMFASALFFDLPRLFVGIGTKLSLMEAWDPERRQFFAKMVAFASLGVAGTASLYGLFAARPPLSTPRVSVTTKKSWRSNRPFRIVQLTDVHVGKTVRAGFIDAVVAQVNKLDADIVVITGDLVDGSVPALGSIVKRLTNMESKYGLYFVTGNHEYYSGATEWVTFLNEIGIRVLANEHLEVGQGEHRIVLSGVNDLHAYDEDAPDCARATAGCDATLPHVMLAHQPKQFLEGKKHGIDLMLSGHTHGGQIFPFNFLVKLQQL